MYVNGMWLGVACWCNGMTQCLRPVGHEFEPRMQLHNDFPNTKQYNLVLAKAGMRTDTPHCALYSDRGLAV